MLNARVFCVLTGVLGCSRNAYWFGWGSWGVLLVFTGLSTLLLWLLCCFDRARQVFRGQAKQAACMIYYSRKDAGTPKISPKAGNMVSLTMILLWAV